MSVAKTLSDALAAQRVDGEARVLPPQVIKSAGRVLQILELFDVLQRRSCVTEISALLKYPQSSTSVLLRSLVEMGYLSYDRYSRTYVPSARVALLGKWVSPDLVCDGSVTALVRRVNEVTGQAVVLGSRDGLLTRYNYVIQADDMNSTFLVQGSVRSVFRFSLGTVLLAELTDSEIRRLIIRHNADVGSSGAGVATFDVLATIEEARKNGYGMAHCGDTNGLGMLAVALPKDVDQDSKNASAIAIAADQNVLKARKDEYLEILRSSIVDMFGREPMVN